MLIKVPKVIHTLTWNPSTLMISPLSVGTFFIPVSVHGQCLGVILGFFHWDCIHILYSRAYSIDNKFKSKYIQNLPPFPMHTAATLTQIPSSLPQPWSCHIIPSPVLLQSIFTLVTRVIFLNPSWIKGWHISSHRHGRLLCWRKLQWLQSHPCPRAVMELSRSVQLGLVPVRVTGYTAGSWPVAVMIISLWLWFNGMDGFSPDCLQLPFSF